MTPDEVAAWAQEHCGVALPDYQARWVARQLASPGSVHTIGATFATHPTLVVLSALREAGQ